METKNKKIKGFNVKGLKKNIRVSLKIKMVLAYALLIASIISVLSYIVYSSAERTMELQTYEALESIAGQAVKVIESRLNARFDVLESLANRNIIRGVWEEGASTDEQKIQVLKEERQRGDFVFLGVADINGKLVTDEGKRLDVSGEMFFKKAISGQKYVSDPQENKISDSMAILFSVPVKDIQGNVINGVLIGAVNIKQFNSLVSDITYGEKGYAFVVNESGTTIAHKDDNKVLRKENIIKISQTNESLKDLAELISKMAKGGKGFGSYVYKGEKRLAGYASVQNTGWSLAVMTPEQEVFRDVKMLAREVFHLGVIFIAAAVVLSLLISSYIVKPIKLAVNHLKIISRGDYTKDMPSRFLKRSDEVGELARAVDELQTNVSTMLSSVKQSSFSVQEKAEVLSAAAQQMAATSGEVSSTVQELAKGAEQQANDVQEIVGIIAEVSASMDEIYENLKMVNSSAETAQEKAAGGKNDIDTLIASIEDVRKAFEEVSLRVGALTSTISQIETVTGVINSISDKTNLLALNAAIEAARVGEAGRGFAVVAEEIRKLAEQSKASSINVGKLVKEVMQETGEVVSTSDNVKGFIDSQVNIISSTIQSFDDILSTVSDIGPMIEQLYLCIDETIRSKNVLQQRVENISAVIQEASASAEEIAASSEQISASTQEIASAAQDLNSTSYTLIDNIKIFKIK